jgi:hypothetical protein
MKFNYFIQLFTFVNIFFISCGSPNSNNLERFSKRLDTSYKTNSTEVESVTRRFYEKGDITSDYVSLAQEIGKKEYILHIVDDKKSSVQLFSDDKMIEKFFDDLKTVINNPKKGLDFRFGTLEEGRISSFGDDEVSLSSNSSSTYLNKSEIDSMKFCYDRYKKEIK